MSVCMYLLCKTLHVCTYIRHKTGKVTQCEKLKPCSRWASAQPASRWGGGQKVAPLYFCDDIVARRIDRKTKFCIHLAEYLPEVVSKFGIDPI